MPQAPRLVAGVPRLRRSLIAVAALLAAAASPAAATSPLPPDALRDAREGLTHLYHARLDSAAAAFERLRARDPGSPAADFLLGGIEWHRVTTGPQGFTAGGEAETRFFARMDAAIETGERRLEGNDDDVAAHFFVGGAYGYQARYLALQEKWWDAYRAGRRGVSHLEKAVKLDPELTDAYLGLGIFHYYADVLPSVLKVLGMLVGMGGDAERGLEEIRAAVRDGDLVGVEGRFFLAEIYTTFEEDHWTAYGYSRALRDEFPENELFTWVNARVLDELHLTDLSRPQWEQLADRAPDLQTKGFLEYRLCRALLYSGDFQAAADRLAESLAYGRMRSARMTMWGRLRYGEALDFLGRHEEAMKQYRLAHELDASDMARDRTSERLDAGRRDPSVISLTELDEVARILRDTGAGGAAAVDVTERRLTGPSRGMTGSEWDRAFTILATLATAHIVRGDPAAGIALVDRALRGSPRPGKESRAALLEVRARADVRLGRAKDARSDLRDARAASAGKSRDRSEALARLVPVALGRGAAPAAGRGPFALDFTAPDRAEFTLEVEGTFLPQGTRLPMTLQDGTWSAAFSVPTGAPVRYRFVVDRESVRPDPEADRIVMDGDTAWCEKAPQPKQANSSPSR